MAASSTCQKQIHITASVRVIHFPTEPFKHCNISIDCNSVVTFLLGTLIVSVFQILTWKDHTRGLPQALLLFLFIHVNLSSFSVCLPHT